MRRPSCVPRRLQEFTLIEALHRRFGQTGRGVLRGIGDDAAVLQPIRNRQFLITTDLLAEGIHFSLQTAAGLDIGYKAAAVNMSDIAAMGGQAEYLLVSIAIPPSRGSGLVQELYRGMMHICRPSGIELVGGDTSASSRDLFLSVTLTGSVEAGHALTRDGARPGDLVYVTGTLGDSRAGLALLTTPPRSGHGPHPRIIRFLIARHRRPTPRLEVGQALSSRRLATAAIDLSDGLSGDLLHLCRRSRVGAIIDATALPLSPALRAYAAVAGVDPATVALQGGEDYELMFTVSPGNQKKLAALAETLSCQISRIGVIHPRHAGVRLRDARGRLQPWRNTSYEHFRAPRSPKRGAAWSH